MPTYKNGRCAWLCQCECGNKCVVIARSLKDGHTRSCGCIVRGSGIKDIRGKRVGRLVAKYPTANRDSKGSVYWHCVCDCGNEVDITESNLIYGSYKSCGCLLEEVKQDIKNQKTLIDGTCIEILEKRKSRKVNTSGYRGVYEKENGRYSVIIGFKRKRYYLGRYKSFEEAVIVRQEAESMIHDGFVAAYKKWKSMGRKEEELIFDVELVNGKVQVTTNVQI